MTTLSSFSVEPFPWEITHSVDRDDTQQPVTMEAFDPIRHPTASSTPINVPTEVEIAPSSANDSARQSMSKGSPAAISAPPAGAIRQLAQRALPTAVGVFLATALPATASPASASVKRVRVVKVDSGQGSQSAIAGPQSPAQRAKNAAENWRLRTSSRLGDRWSEPHISMSPWDEAVMEWWNRDRKITLYFQPDGKVQYIKVWGPDIDTEMEEGMLDEPGFDALWQWIRVE